MNEINLNELQVLVNSFKQEKEKDNAKNYIVKVNQQNEDGNINLIIYAGDKQIYQLPENYKLDKSNLQSVLFCRDNHCRESWEHDIINSSSPHNKIKFIEEYDNHFDHFFATATFYDDHGNMMGGYGAELSTRYDQEVPEFIIYDIHNIPAT